MNPGVQKNLLIRTRTHELWIDSPKPIALVTAGQKKCGEATSTREQPVIALLAALAWTLWRRHRHHNAKGDLKRAESNLLPVGPGLPVGGLLDSAGDRP